MKLPAVPPSFEKLLQKLVEGSSLEKMASLFSSDIGICDERGRYLHWDKLRFVIPPGDLDNEEYWFALKQARKKFYRDTGLIDKAGKPFQFCLSDELLRSLHLLDQYAAGQISMPVPIANSNTRDVYLVSSLIEESINSSQLEGASTTRDVAKDMLRQKRSPRDKSEQMIFNNYQAMQAISELKDEPLTPQLIFHLHEVLTLNTLEQKDKAGKFRGEEDEIRVVDNRDAQVLHIPPKASELPGRIKRLCDFANTDVDEMNFFHPVIKAMILHFMIGYEHPFVDGNGRTARALFYWYLAKHGYWLIEFVSISKIIKHAPSKYSRAFLLTETDDNDLTYFLLHQAGVLRAGIDELFEYLQKKTDEIAQAEHYLQGSSLKGILNHRQLMILQKALKNQQTIFDIQEHRSIHAISYQTARTDLLALADTYHLLDKRKQGKGFVFIVPMDINDRILEFKN